MAAPPKKSLKRKPNNELEKPHKNPKKSFKKKFESDVAVPLQIEDDAPDFPRGGGSVLSRREEEEARAEADAEFLDEERELTNNKKKKRTKKFEGAAAADDDLGSLFGAGITGKLPRFTNKITLKNISPRMKLWGVITEINSKDLVISLPGGLRGFVRAEEASDLLKNGAKEPESNMLCSIFHVGQLVSCIVLQVDDDKREGKGSRRIWLSLCLSLLHKGLTLDTVQDGMVLTAYVKSIEDHGCILHFGSSSFSGFLPRDNGENKMTTGQLLQGVVKSIDKARGVVYLNSDPSVVSKCVTKDLKGLSIDLLVPGMMVNASVQATLENGIMLSFLTYFTGTVDIFHLQNSYPHATWKDDYNQIKKVTARILFIDPSTRAVGLTMNPHLVHNKAPPLIVKTGDIYDSSRVVRVDRGFGLLLEIPSTPIPTPAYISIFDVADEEVRKLEKKFKEGSHVRIRVLGFRHLEGLAMGTLKASAFEGSVFTHSDLKPGMVVKAKVIAVENFGAIVQLSSGVKALCPLPHMSEFEIVKPAKKFKMGAELPFRVLGCKSKRITVTHKKTLVKSKLDILASFNDAINGSITHGWITKIEKHGCFVRFYNGVHGFAHRSELGLQPGIEASSTYHVGQVVKCRVISAAPSSRRINLSLIISPKRSSDDTVKLGSLVSGVVEQLTPNAIIVNVNKKGYVKGTIFNEHLADHQGHASTMKSLLRPGYEFDQLLVLDVEASCLILSAKHSLIYSVEQLPLEVAQIHPHSVVHGYICNLIETGCFVRFLGRLTGFSPKNKAVDDRRADLSEVFYIGQSVRSHFLNVNDETSRITISLKQSSCFSTDSSFIQGYFLLDEKIAKLQMLDSKSSDLKWVEKFKIGSVVEGTIQEKKEFGVILSFEGHTDVVGFITHYQMGGISVEAGSVVRGLVLDISMADHLVDLSLKPELVNKENGSDCMPSKKKRQREPCMDLLLHQTVNAVVEIVKEKYLVLSIPEYNHAIGFASITDYNIQKIAPKHFVNGQSVVATIEAHSSPSTAGRLLLLRKSLSSVSETSTSKRAKRKSCYTVGTVVEAEITDIKPHELRLNFGVGFHGRVHITEVGDVDHHVENPLSKFKIGQQLTARIVAKAHQSGKSGKSYLWELSLSPSMLAGNSEMDDGLVGEDFDFSIGKVVTGYVLKVDTDWVWLTVSRYVKAQLFILDSSCEPKELQEFKNRFNVGQAVSGPIISINKEKKLLRLGSSLSPVLCRSLLDNDIDKVDDTTSRSINSNENGTKNIHEGDIRGGRITKVLPGVGGLLVQIGPHLHGKVHFTELTDMWVSNPLSGYQEGQFVKCKVLEIGSSLKGNMLVDLSLRSSEGIQSASSTGFNNDSDFLSKRFEKIEDFHPNMDVQGYVKSVTSKGCFIMLSRKIDARILLSNLSDRYIENLEKEFPIGKLVNGKVLSVEPLSKRVDVTLKTTGSRGSKFEVGDFHDLHVGEVISGKIRRVEAYGLFITINHTNMVGLCHISELSDDQIENIETKYKAGERVVAKVLKVDEERHRISLGMKSSYIEDGSSLHIPSNHKVDELIDGDGDGDGAIDTSELIVQEDDNLATTREVNSDHTNREYPVLAQAESRASVLPLDVTLDEMEVIDADNVVTRTQEDMNETDNAAGKNQRRAKKKAKEERELEIRAAEERLLENNEPSTVDEFEKMVRSSPNSSYVWIKYMAFMLSLADVEKARSIAERALQTINIREEGEKLNIWVAYFNLENEYGSPPEEAVMKIFQRALQYCDHKKLYLALLGMFERTEKHKLADELLDKMTKKYKNSCKIWLRRVQSFLKAGKDGVQSVVNRALLSLPRNKHIKFISQTGILEFKCGVPERARSMFEGMLREYPKRTDLWKTYLDQEIRLGDSVVIRALFERATSLSLPPKKMKFLFKKYLVYEASCGDEERIEYVKKKAMEYVESPVS